MPDLTDHRCIRYRSPKTGRTQAWKLLEDGAIGTSSIPASIVLNAPDAVVAAVRSGAGIAEVPERVVRSELADRALIALFEDLGLDDPGREIWLMWPPDRHHQPKVRAFVDHIAALFL